MNLLLILLIIFNALICYTTETPEHNSSEDVKSFQTSEYNYTNNNAVINESHILLHNNSLGLGLVANKSETNDSDNTSTKYEPQNELNKTNANIVSTDGKAYGNESTTIRTVNRRSVNKIYGYFSRDGKFNFCPKLTDNTKEEQKLNSSYLKCLYFDESKLRQRFDRKIESKTGFKGIYGYYKNRTFHYCPGPEKVDPDPLRTDIRYIPFYLNFDPDCHYFDHNPGEMFDYKGLMEKRMANNSDQLKSFSIFVLISVFVFKL